MEIIGFENYLIYPDGRVWSKIGKGRFMNPYKIKSGYICIRLCKESKVKNFRLHRIVAEHYIPNPENKPEVDHINRIKDDNSVENLRWVSSKENCNNRKLPSTKKNIISGHRYINKNRNSWEVNIIGKRKYFKSKIDAICYKYILLLKIKSKILY